MRKLITRGIIFLGICTIIMVSCVSSPETPEIVHEEDASVTLEPTEVPVKVEPTLKPTREPTEEPTETPVPTDGPTHTPQPADKPEPQIGEVWMDVPGEPVTQGTEFAAKVYLNSGEKKLAAYGLSISYDPAIVSVDTDKGNAGVEPGVDGFVAAVNTSEPGNIVAAGFDVYGKGPGEKLHVITVYWKAVGSGTSAVNIVVNSLVDDDTMSIGAKKGMSTVIEVRSSEGPS